jgi:hypothetical protein
VTCGAFPSGGRSRPGRAGRPSSTFGRRRARRRAAAVAASPRATAADPTAESCGSNGHRPDACPRPVPADGCSLLAMAGILSPEIADGYSAQRPTRRNTSRLPRAGRRGRPGQATLADESACVDEVDR